MTVAGVNAHIDTMAHRPLEYVFLGARPMKWGSPDSVAVALLRSYSPTRSYRLGVPAGKEVLDLMAPGSRFAPSLEKTAGLPVAGDHHTLNAGFRDNTSFFDMNSGGVIRMIVDFSDLDSATIISPPGQSGHFMSPYYDDVAALWARGDQTPMGFYGADGLAQSLVLAPDR